MVSGEDTVAAGWGRWVGILAMAGSSVTGLTVVAAGGAGGATGERAGLGAIAPNPMVQPLNKRLPMMAIALVPSTIGLIPLITSPAASIQYRDGRVEFSYTLQFSPPLPPGQTITLALAPHRNPRHAGVYLFGLQAYPVGENPQPSFIGYARLSFYERDSHRLWP